MLSHWALTQCLKRRPCLIAWLNNAGVTGLTTLLSCSPNRAEGRRGEIYLQNTGGNFLLAVGAAVPAALLQYESHGKPRSSPCLLSTVPSWRLVPSSEGNQGGTKARSFPEAPCWFSSSLQSPRPLHAQHPQRERLERRSRGKEL